MARVFTSGLETGDLFDFSEWSSSSAAMSGAIVHTGSFALKLPSYSHWVRFRLPTVQTVLFVRLWLYMENEQDGTPRDLVSFEFTDGQTCRLRSNASGSVVYFDAYRGSTKLAAGSIAVPINEWHMFEVRLEASNTDGLFESRIDGVADISFLGDTVPGSSDTVQTIQFRGLGGGGHANYLDDIAINDGTGSDDNSWPEDGRIIAVQPDAAGDQADFSPYPAADSNWKNVDEIPHDGDVSYNYSGVNGHRDLFNLTACGLTNVDISRILVKVRARKEVAVETDKIRLLIKSGGTVSTGGDADLLTTYTAITEQWRQDPATAASWTVTALDALQAGYENRT